VENWELSDEYYRPIEKNREMPAQLHFAAKKHKILNEPLEKNELSPCFLLDERGFCRGHPRYGQENAEHAKIYGNPFEPDEKARVECGCAWYTCDFFDKHAEFYQKNFENLLPELEKCATPAQKMDFVVRQHRLFTKSKKKLEKYRKKARKFK